MRMPVPLARVLACSCLLATTPALADAPRSERSDGIEGELFDSWLGKYTDLTTEGLWSHLHLEARPAPEAPLSFSPAKARFYDRVASKLALSGAARQQLQRDGLVVVPQKKTYSMAAAFYAIYTADLPVLVTTDAILDAMHRSFDKILSELEAWQLRTALQSGLEAAHAAIPALAKQEPLLLPSLVDCDLYLTVALNLLALDPIDPDATVTVAPRLAPAPEVAAILAKILKLEPDGGPATTLYGAGRTVDWSQFKPRGHYDTTAELQQYFRALMWLGRADTGFGLDVPRQLRDAAVLTRLMNESGASTRIQIVRDIVDLMVGRSDALSPAELGAVLIREKLAAPGALAKPDALAKLADALAATGQGTTRIRSQAVDSPADPHAKAPPAGVFQLFGQRFILDSFILSKVVFDDILFHGEKQNRRMPTGLDVMAALGNDTAARLLGPELDRWHYAANLATLRDLVAHESPASWSDNLYGLWLDALRTLAVPPTGANVPEIMRRAAWQKKSLQTTLASWAELRHDTVLYAEQSYSAGGCVYPAGFVEPYPAFYAKLGRFARAASVRFTALGTANQEADAMAPYVRYFDAFATTMDTLQHLAEKELAATPFDAADTKFLKTTIEKHDVESNPYDPQANWDGWYVGLVYSQVGDLDENVLKAKPTIADVHTDPDAGTVLEVGTGNVDFTVAAIDNAGDRAVYVGPTLSYYEFEHPATDRLTDTAWIEKLAHARTTPARPAWMKGLIQR